jgi:hypothetical protein
MWRASQSGLDDQFVISGHWSLKNGTITLDEEKSAIFRAGRPLLTKFGMTLGRVSKTTPVEITPQKIIYGGNTWTRDP